MGNNNNKAPSSKNHKCILLEKVKSYKENLLKNGVLPPVICPKCKNIQDYFYSHERKQRIFLVIVGRLVYKITSLLQRWKCPSCKKTFTEYPDFALPYKRYVQDEIIEKSLNYVLEEKNTYRKLTYEVGEKICYEGYLGIKKGMQFSHSSIHRWLGWMEKLENYLMGILLKLKNAGVSSEIFRKTQNILTRKYRSEKRKKVLEICGMLFEANKEHQKIFGKGIFPLRV